MVFKQKSQNHFPWKTSIENPITFLNMYCHHFLRILILLWSMSPFAILVWKSNKNEIYDSSRASQASTKIVSKKYDSSAEHITRLSSVAASTRRKGFEIYSNFINCWCKEAEHWQQRNLWTFYSRFKPWAPHPSDVLVVVVHGGNMIEPKFPPSSEEGANI